MTNSNHDDFEDLLPYFDVDRRWRTHPRTGWPRLSWNLERLARHWGAKLGYRLHRSRKSEDGKEFILVHKASSAVVLGAGYTAPIESVLEFLERERKLEAQKKHRSKH